MSTSNEIILEKNWQIIVEYGFSRLYLDENNLNILFYERNAVDYITTVSAASNICALISEDNLSLVQKIYARIRKQVEGYLSKRVLPKITEARKENLFLEALSGHWHAYARFKEWLESLFSGLNRKIEEHGVFEDCEIFDTEHLADECFVDIIVSPWAPYLTKQMSRKFEKHITCVTPSLIDADIDLLSSMTNLLKVISTPRKDFWSGFRTCFAFYREREYHQMAYNWVNSLCLEDFVSCIIRHSEREKVAAAVCFDRTVAKDLHDLCKRVFYGIYLPKIFSNSLEQYTEWINEAKKIPLERVNKGIVVNRALVLEVTEIFRVSFLENICSSLGIGIAPFMTTVGGSKRPLHVYCLSRRSGGRILRQDGLSMDNIMHAMLNSFGRYADLISAFSAGRFLQGSCERVLISHAQQCTNCILPHMMLSFCRSVLANHGRFCVSSEIKSCYANVFLFLKYTPHPHPFGALYAEDLYRRVLEESLVSVPAEQLIVSAFSRSDEQGHIRQGVKMLRNHVESQKYANLFTASPFFSAFQQQNRMAMTFKVNLFRQGTVESRRHCCISVPHEIQVCHKNYADFFRSHQTDAKVEWDYALGTVRIQTHLFSNGNRNETELELNVEQFAVLNLFQERDSFSLRSLMDRVVMAPSGSSERKQTLRILRCVISSMTSDQCPLLIKNPDSTTFAATDVLTLNTHFKSEKPDFKIPKPDYDKSKQPDSVAEEPDKKLFYVIEAAIMSTMKNMRLASRELLFSLVCAQVDRFLELSAKSFDTCVERLIEREFIERKDGKTLCFSYVH